MQTYIDANALTSLEYQGSWSSRQLELKTPYVQFYRELVVPQVRKMTTRWIFLALLLGLLG